MEITQTMLEAAVKKAVEVGLLPRMGDMESYVANWEAVQSIVQAALDADCY